MSDPFLFHKAHSHRFINHFDNFKKILSSQKQIIKNNSIHGGIYAIKKIESTEFF